LQFWTHTHTHTHTHAHTHTHTHTAENPAGAQRNLDECMCDAVERAQHATSTPLELLTEVARVWPSAIRRSIFTPFIYLY
jgi:hypothetical protein